VTVRTDATREAACAAVDDREVVARGEAFGDSYIGILGNALTVSEIRRTRRFAHPNAVYGLRYVPGAVAAGNHRPYAGLDLYVVDQDGHMDNSSVAGRSDGDGAADDRPLIAMFGGSTMMGMGSRLPEFTIPALTERILFSEHGITARCRNYGIGGTTSVEALSLLLHEVAPLKPRVNVFYDGWNDCSYFTTLAALAADTRSPLSLAARQAVDLRQLELNVMMPTLSSPRRALGLAARLGASWLASGVGDVFPPAVRRPIHGATARVIPLGIHREFSRLRGDSSDERLIDAVPTAAGKFASIHAVARFVSASCGAAFIHALQPLTLWGRKPFTENERDYATTGYSTGSTAPFEPFKRRVIDELGDQLIDLTDTFAEEPDEVYTDSGHLNRLGNLIVASRLAAAIAARWEVKT
jgi:hypothetical protein